MSVVRLEFIRRVLKDEAIRLEKNQGLQMKKLLHFRTGSLFNDRSFSVSDSSSNSILSIKHKNYQRFLDMKRIHVNADGKVRQQSFPIHNRFVMGHFNQIGDRLMYDLTEDLVKQIKTDLNIN